jgi:hypothetical protein
MSRPPYKPTLSRRLELIHVFAERVPKSIHPEATPQLLESTRAALQVLEVAVQTALAEIKAKAHADGVDPDQPQARTSSPFRFRKHP